MSQPPPSMAVRACVVAAGICVWALFTYLLVAGPPHKSSSVERGVAAVVSSSSAGAVSSGSADGQLSMPYGAFAFEVYGRVQGVWFRKYTVARAQALHLVGWCANSQRGTVMGECQGKPEDLEVMKEWLCTEGSPHSHIERCDIRQERSIPELQYQVFDRRPNVP